MVSAFLDWLEGLLARIGMAAFLWFAGSPDAPWDKEA